MGREAVIKLSSTGIPAAPLRNLSLWFAVALLLASVYGGPGARGIPVYYWVKHDAYVLMLCIAVAMLFGFGKLLPPLRFSLPELTRRSVLATGAALALLLWAGTYLVICNYPVSRDEHMVLFDMGILREGKLAAPVSPEWRPYILALTPDFILRQPGDQAWVSGYLPMNALIRMAFSSLLDPALMNPLLAGIGAIALYDIVKRLFPRRASAPAVALLLYLTSAQMLAAAMTTYAMTAHLVFNLIWLALFLRNTRSSHACAIGIGFLAMGLHQVIFHPLFALPFLDVLRRRGEWRIFAAYIAGYAVFGLFWINYPSIIASFENLTAAASPGAPAGGSNFFTDRVLPLLLAPQPTLPLMNLNLMRFVTWENLALVPLALIGLSAVRRDEGIARPLCYGLVLTILAMALLLPLQGHGWGYRYLHGVIGNAILLAVYGWHNAADRDHARAFLTAGTLATVCISIPFLMWKAHGFVRPYAELDRKISAIPADFAVLDSQWPSYAVDLVRNDPFLRSRPIRISSLHLNEKRIAELCSRGTIAFVMRDAMKDLPFADVPPPAGETRAERLQVRIAGQRCGATSTD